MGSGLGSKELEDEVGEAVDDGRLLDKAGCGIDHAENAHPMRDAVEIAKLTFEIAQHRQGRELCGHVALLKRQLASDLAQRLREGPLGALRPVSGKDRAISDQAHVYERKDNAGRRRERRRQDQAESGEAGFDFGHDDLLKTTCGLRCATVPPPRWERNKRWR